MWLRLRYDSQLLLLLQNREEGGVRVGRGKEMKKVDTRTGPVFPSAKQNCG